MQDQTTASEISANGQKSDSEAHEMETTPSSVSVPIEEDAITQTEDLFIEKVKTIQMGIMVSILKRRKYLNNQEGVPKDRDTFSYYRM